jgi:hypothetical protein
MPAPVPPEQPGRNTPIAAPTTGSMTALSVRASGQLLLPGDPALANAACSAPAPACEFAPGPAASAGPASHGAEAPPASAAAAPAHPLFTHGSTSELDAVVKHIEVYKVRRVMAPVVTSLLHACQTRSHAFLSQGGQGFAMLATVPSKAGSPGTDALCVIKTTPCNAQNPRTVNEVNVTVLMGKQLPLAVRMLWDGTANIDGQRYQVMALAAGTCSLDAVVHNLCTPGAPQSLQPAALAYTSACLLSALKRMVALGVLHFDIKPGGCWACLRPA